MGPKTTPSLISKGGIRYCEKCEKVFRNENHFKRHMKAEMIMENSDPITSPDINSFVLGDKTEPGCLVDWASLNLVLGKHG